MDTTSASSSSSRFAAVAIVAAALLLLPALSAADDWQDAHATFYGDETGGETMRKNIIYILSLFICCIFILVYMYIYKYTHVCA